MDRDPRESESDLLSPLRTQRGKGEEEEQENAPVPDVDEQLRNLELNPRAERALKEGWTHKTTPQEDLAVTKTAQEHLTDFFTEYDDHHDFERARDAHNSARYVALVKLKNKPDAECSDRELRLKELWVVTDPFRSVPRELRVILMDIIEYPESSRDEALAAWYRKITGEPETRNGRSNIV